MAATTTNREARRPRTKAGFSLIELLIVIAIILIIAAIAIPNLIRSRMAANEASAAGHIRAMATAATVYSATWDNGYPPSLTAMGGSGLVATCNNALLLDPVMTTAPFHKGGYTFSYTGVGPTILTTGPGCGAPGFNAYLTAATPISVGFTGNRSFCSDLPGVIHFDPTGAAISSVGACDALAVLQ